MFDSLLTSTTGIGYLLSLLIGYVLFRWPSFRNKLIPAVHFIIAVLTYIANQFVTPTPVEPVVGFATMGFFSGDFFKALVHILLQTAASTGAWSAPKNIAQGVKEVSEHDSIMNTPQEIREKP